MPWDPELDELARRRELAKTMGGPDPVQTRHYLQRFVEMAYRALEQDRGKKARVGFRP